MSLHIQLFCFLLIFAAFFPDDLIRLLAIVYLKVSVLTLDLVLYCHSRWIHHKLSRAMSDLGLPPPSFKYIPIEDRDHV